MQHVCRFGGGGRFGDRGGRPRGGGPGRKTNHRIIVENLSSRTSWQVGKTFNPIWDSLIVRAKLKLEIQIMGANRKGTDRIIINLLIETASFILVAN